jgi:hypothetical protein
MRIIVAAALLALSVPAFAAAPEPKTEDDKTMYALGALVSRNFKDFKLSADQVKQVQVGMTDSLTGKKLTVDMEKQTPKVQEFLKAYMPSHPGQPEQKDPKAAAPKVKPDQKTLYALGVLASKNLTDLSLSPAQVGMMEKGMADTWPPTSPRSRSSPRPRSPPLATPARPRRAALPPSTPPSRAP